jgi:anti-anti-sigma factor
MPISSVASSDGSELTVSIEGRFDFSCHQEFRRAYEDAAQTPERYIIDMGGTSYLDSSALGMLLLLRDYAGGDTSNVSIVNCNSDVKKILAISNFEQLFKVQ